MLKANYLRYRPLPVRASQGTHCHSFSDIDLEARRVFPIEEHINQSGCFGEFQQSLWRIWSKVEPGTWDTSGDRGWLLQALGSGDAAAKATAGSPGFWWPLLRGHPCWSWILSLGGQFFIVAPDIFWGTILWPFLWIFHEFCPTFFSCFAFGQERHHQNLQRLRGEGAEKLGLGTPPSIRAYVDCLKTFKRGQSVAVPKKTKDGYS